MRVFPKSLVVIAVLITGTVSLVATNSSATISTATCTASNLRLGLGPKVGPVVGEQALIFTVTNQRASKCQVHGYPTVQFFDSKNVVLALHYTSTLGSTSPYVRLSQPRTVVLTPGSRTYFKVAKYRCDQGDARVAQSMIITLNRTGFPGGFDLHWVLLPNFVLKSGGLFFLERQFELDR